MKQSKKLLSLALALVMGLTLAAPAMAAEETKTEDGKIVILHTNDAHTHIDNTQTVGEGEEAAEVPALRYSTIAGYRPLWRMCCWWMPATMFRALPSAPRIRATPSST